MRPERLLRLALGEVGSPLWRSWALALGIALGVGSLVLLLGLAQGVGDALRERVVGSLPDRIRVEPASFRMGPVNLEGGLDDEAVARLRALPGVEAVFRQARFPRPAQLEANYGGQGFWSDVVLEGVDPGLVEDHVARGQAFGTLEDGSAAAVLPQVMMDVLAAGVSIHTSLPQLSPDLLVGRHFNLTLGRSSFAPASGPVSRHRCTIVGISDQVGVGGPSVPLEVLQSWSAEPLTFHAVTLKLEDAGRVGEVAARVRELGYQTPGLEVARQVSQAVGWVQAALGLFGGAVLLVAGVGIFTGLSLQVREEEPTIGLFRAVGASRRDILALYLMRAGLLGLSGALVGLAGGILLGAWLAEGLKALAGAGAADLRLFHPTWSSALGGPAFGVLTALAAGLLPAGRAARLPPAEALRR